MALTLPFLILSAAVCGALIGSYCNVVAFRERGDRRWRERLTQLGGRSRCPSCETFIDWWALVPVAGWLVLRGRCSACKAPISPVYPIIEALVAVCSGLLAAVIGMSWWLAPALAVLWVTAPTLARLLFDANEKTPA